ncbi:IPT/TIG domain-containing protein [Streptomyces sp. NPDC037389]|uniref:IPT/TIG domain-containing protein n=1 Tax=Streptomyces sp. NPDC037389 TaxID=3155369 RepID=UPI0033F8F2D2
MSEPNTPKPSLTKLEPASGSMAGGKTVKVHGNRLDYVYSVTFGGHEVEKIVPVSGTEIEVITPSHNEGTVVVYAYSDGGPSNPMHYTYTD